MQFHNEPLVPLRVPKAIERLDPPLIDIYVEDGERRGRSKVNPAEAKIIVDDVEKIINDPALSHFGGDRSCPRSIGVISLIGCEQAAYAAANHNFTGGLLNGALKGTYRLASGSSDRVSTTDSAIAPMGTIRRSCQGACPRGREAGRTT